MGRGETSGLPVPPRLTVHATIEFVAFGKSAPAGSKSLGRRNDGTAFVRHSNAARLRPWTAEIRRAAAEAMNGAPLLRGPLLLDVVFYRPRPANHLRRDGTLGAAGERAPYPIARPDLTKLVRALEDALKGICWADDAQVVRQSTEKLWGEPNRAEVRIQALG